MILSTFCVVFSAKPYKCRHSSPILLALFFSCAIYFLWPDFIFIGFLFKFLISCFHSSSFCNFFSKLLIFFFLLVNFLSNLFNSSLNSPSLEHYHKVEKSSFLETKLFTGYLLLVSFYSLLITFCSLLLTFYSPFVTCYYLFVIRYTLIVTCYIILVTRYLLLITRYFLLVTRYFLLVAHYFWLVTCYFFLVTRYYLLVTRYFLLVTFTRYLALLTCYSFLLTRYTLCCILTVLHYIHNACMKL